MKSISVAFLALAIASARAAPALINLEGFASPGASGAVTSSDDLLSGAAALSPGAKAERAIPIVGDLLVGAGIVTAAVANPMVPQPVASVASPGNLVGSVATTLNGGTIGQRSLIDLSNAAAPGSNVAEAAFVPVDGEGFAHTAEDLLDGHGLLSPGQNDAAAAAAIVRPKKRDLIDLSGILAPGSKTNGFQELSDSLLNGVGALSPGQNTNAGAVIPITGANPVVQPVVASKRGLIDLDGVLSPGIDNPKGTLADVEDSLFDGTNALSPGANNGAAAQAVRRGLIDLSGVLSPGGENLQNLGDALLEGQNALSPGASAAPVVVPVAVPVALPKRQLLDLSNAVSPGSNTEALQHLDDALLDGSGIFSPGQNSNAAAVAAAIVDAANKRRQLLDLSNAVAPGSNTNVIKNTLDHADEALFDGAGILSPGSNTVEASQPSVVVPATMIRKRDLPVVGALTSGQAPAEALAALDGLLPLGAVTNGAANLDGATQGVAALPSGAAAVASKRQVQGMVDVATAPFIGETGSATAVTGVPLQAPVDAVLQAVPIAAVHRKRSQASKRYDGSLIDIHGAGSPGADTTGDDASTALLNAQDVLSPGAKADTKGPLDALDDIPYMDQLVNLKGTLAPGNGKAVPVAVPVAFPAAA